MELLTMCVVAISALLFIGVGAYLHMLRKRAERIIPAPFLNPAGKRKPKKKKR
jgi:hypothetical protein